MKEILKKNYNYFISFLIQIMKIVDDKQRINLKQKYYKYIDYF